MSTVILLSSSPPPVFARSPTPVRSSSPLPSTAALLQSRSPGRKKFKPTAGTRDGFRDVFTTARAVLAEKSGAENAIISSPGRNRFRSSQDEIAEDKKDGAHAPTVKPISNRDARATAQDETVREQKTSTTTELIAQRILENTCSNDGRVSPQPLLLERATARRLDWTPPQMKVQRDENERPLQYSAGYLNGMLNNFAYADAAKPAQHTIEAHNPAKRRRVGPVLGRTTKPATKPTPVLAEPKPLPPKAPAKRTRSPTKKALTITGLATSNYLGDEQPDESPMMQYLTSTQARLDDVPTDSILETKVQQTKAAAKRLKEKKKGQAKSLLLSPKSALKTYDDQDAIFGSASQLAREESPGFLRETLQAIKESESFMLSDPFSSPQHTQALSADNTPQAGTSRYRRSRNLWAAAGRDEDNALLHVDTVDLTDTPAVRAALTGKDVMLQPASKQSASTSDPSMSLRGGGSPSRLYKSRPIIDIGDIPSPQANSKRTISSTTRGASPRKSPNRATVGAPEVIITPTAAVIAPVEPPPPRPNYAGLTIHELNKQIKSYGFKAMRKREKMIELLDRCWAEKYGIVEPVQENEPEAVPFGDFLSKVHDISARSAPKAKKVRVSKKKSETEGKPDEKAAKKPRARKKKEPLVQAAEVAMEKPKPQRKRKSKTVAAVGYSVHDVDSIWDTVPAELRALEAFDDWAKPEKKVPKSKKNSKPAVENVPSTTTALESSRLPTPPATLRADDAPPPFTESTADSPTNHIAMPAEPVLTPTPTPLPNPIESQITAAIMHQSQNPPPDRNHNIHPTWHEKILLYDPIVLEDLASWLNTEGLGAVGEDREVSALDVRGWCETRGVCCLWRGGWRGNKVAQSQDQ